jgi:V8-like Glu-specific endopeptidase
LYKVKETYAEIKTKFNVRPLTLLSHRPLINDPIEVISGFWKKGYNCHIETFVDQLKEEGWMMKDSARYTRPGCETVGGTSGSPVILAGTRNVIAINNTGNEDGEKCTENNPCEIDSTGNITFVKGYSYAQQTYWIYSCLNAVNEIDVHSPECQLFH